MPIQNPSDIRLNERADLEAIIGRPPGWALRWGMVVLFGVLGLLLLIAWQVRYPDIVEARTVLTTERPPIRVTAKASARLDELNVANGQAINEGDVLAVLENPASAQDVLLLEKFIAAIGQNDPGSYLAIEPPDNLQLGSLEATYARFSKSFAELKYFLKQDINYLKISNLRKQILQLERLNSSLDRQATILNDEVGVAYSGFRRDSILLAQKSISRLEYEATQTVWLRNRRELENLKSGTVQNDLSTRQMEAQILDLQQLRSDDESNRLLTFRSETERLRGETEVWKNTWLLTAPIAGEVALTAAWSEQQFVREGEEVLTIVPAAGSGNVIGKALLTGPGIGKLTPGMAVLLRLDGFPYQEFGVLNGRLERIAEVPGAAGYEARISLPGGMKTSHGHEIPFRQEMQATARVVTEERSLLARVMERILGGVERN